MPRVMAAGETYIELRTRSTDYIRDIIAETYGGAMADKISWTPVRFIPAGWLCDKICSTWPCD